MLKTEKDNWLLIRPFVVSDIDAVCAIEEYSFHAKWSRKNIIDASRNSLNTLLVATVQRNDCLDLCPATGIPIVAGYICFRIVYEELYIEKVAVHSSLRRRGIATRLVSEALRMGRKCGAERCALETAPENTAAICLYSGIGFTPVAAGDKKRQVTMLKPL